MPCHHPQGVEGRPARTRTATLCGSPSAGACELSHSCSLAWKHVLRGCAHGGARTGSPRAVAEPSVQITEAGGRVRRTRAPATVWPKPRHAWRAGEAMPNGTARRHQHQPGWPPSATQGRESAPTCHWHVHLMAADGCQGEELTTTGSRGAYLQPPQQEGHGSPPPLVCVCTCCCDLPGGVVLAGETLGGRHTHPGR